MHALANLVLAPLFLLNKFGTIVAAVWLLILGDWPVVLLTIAIAVSSSFLTMILLLPSMLFVAPLAFFSQRQSLLGTAFCGFLSLFYTAVAICAWSLFIFILFSRGIDGRNLIPVLLISYGAAIGPWMYAAQQEFRADQDAPGTAITVFFAQLAYIASVVVALLTPLSILQMALVFLGVMMIGIAIQIIATAMSMSGERSAFTSMD